MESLYGWLGRRVVVHLYSREGMALGTLEGRVADVAKGVEVAPGMRKDLAYVVDIETDGAPYKNSSGKENEGWFAVQDLEARDPQLQRWFVN